MSLVVGVNTYVDLLYFDEYLASRYNSTAVAALDDAVKETLLTSATRGVDSYCSWSGSKTDPLQTLEFPRDGDTDVDEQIKVAECEIAVSIFESNSSVDTKEPNLKRMKVDVVEFVFGDVSSTNSLYSSYTDSLLRPYCSVASGTGGKRLTRV